jgi:hypothetical protein
MFEDADKPRDFPPFSELDPGSQDQWKMLAISLLLPPLITHIRFTIGDFLKEKEISRQHDPSQLHNPENSKATPDMVPSPIEIVKLIKPLPLWNSPTEKPDVAMKAMSLSLDLVRMLFENKVPE